MKGSRTLAVQAKRQVILDYLNANGGSTINALLRHTGEKHRDCMLDRLQRMAEYGELSTTLMDKRTILYVAQATTTREGYFRGPSTDATFHTPEPRRQASRPRGTTPGRTVHRMDDHPPIPNQGGQGSLSARYSGGSVLSGANSNG